MADPPHAVAAHRLLRAIVDEFVRCGMRAACTSPGSRNTPIVLALARDSRIRVYSHIDERCAGFFAVGAAKANGRPLAVTCTSGTAAAELLPAIVEARWARVPLIVLTADRPAELREVGAGQAIDQIKLYGDAVKWFCELELPAAVDAAAMRWTRRLADRAWWTACSGSPGPVHLNIPLREPLVLEAELPPEPAELGGRPDGMPWAGRPDPDRSGPARAMSARRLPARTVIVAGSLRSGSAASAIDEAAERIGAPVLADPLSGARGGTTSVATYDLLLRDPAISEELLPERVIRLGDLPTSKPLRAWLAGLPATVPQTLIDPEGAWHDPDAVVREIDIEDPVAVMRSLRADAGADGEFLSRWRRADAAATDAMRDALGDRLTEPGVALGLGEWMTPEQTLFVAASMPIRDVELFLPARVPLPHVLANRGANGIDGTVSAAFGAAAAAPQRPVVLLIGDVALLHDIGGLLAARRLGLAITIVLIENDGGGIFDFLAVSREGDAFTRHIATPHGIVAADIARLYGFAYRRPETVAELRDAVLSGMGSGAATLIEVSSDRAANVLNHRALARVGLEAARRALQLDS